MSISVELVDEPIDLSRWQTTLDDPDVGAHVWLYGTTRRTTRLPARDLPARDLPARDLPATGHASNDAVGQSQHPSETATDSREHIGQDDVEGMTVRRTQTLYYEAHRSMALEQLRQIATQAVAQFGVVGVIVIHRLGDVPVGQMSVAVGCASAHRRPALDAVAWIMEAIKRDVPIWKRETFADGRVEWVHPAE